MTSSDTYERCGHVLRGLRPSLVDTSNAKCLRSNKQPRAERTPGEVPMTAKRTYLTCTHSLYMSVTTVHRSPALSRFRLRHHRPRDDGPRGGAPPVVAARGSSNLVFESVQDISDPASPFRQNCRRPSLGVPGSVLVAWWSKPPRHPHLWCRCRCTAPASIVAASAERTVVVADCSRE